MTTPALRACAALAPLIQSAPRLSAWMQVDQARIDAFADVTEDHQFIHLDAERAAAETPFGGTIAHGFLTLSMGSKFAYEVMEPIEGQTASINYGFDKVRFLSPVRAGSEIRGAFVLERAEPKGDTAILLDHAFTIEIKGQDTPALAARWLSMISLA